MNRRDDCAEALFATDFLTMSAVATHTVDWQKFVAGKGASEGAAAFVNNAG